MLKIGIFRKFRGIFFILTGTSCRQEDPKFREGRILAWSVGGGVLIILSGELWLSRPCCQQIQIGYRLYTFGDDYCLMWHIRQVFLCVGKRTYGNIFREAFVQVSGKEHPEHLELTN